MKKLLLSVVILLGLPLLLNANTSIQPDKIVLPGTIKPLVYQMDGTTKVFKLIAEPVKHTIYNQKINTLLPFQNPKFRYKGRVEKLPMKIQEIEGWGYNNSIPGPAIIVNQGDKIRIHVENKLPGSTTVHWHGILLPNDMDGTGEAVQKPIEPGQIFVYEYTITNLPGTYMYHSGFNDTKQVEKGLSGFFIVLPQSGKSTVDKDFAIMLQEWSIPQNSSKINLLTMSENWFTFNGVVAPNFPVLQVNEGDKVRIRFGDMGLFAHPIHLHGHTFLVTGTEGGPIPESAQWPGATIGIMPGQTRDIEFIAKPGLWRLHCHILNHIINDHSFFEKQPIKILPIGGMYTYLYVEPK